MVESNCEILNVNIINALACNYNHIQRFRQHLTKYTPEFFDLIKLAHIQNIDASAIVIKQPINQLSRPLNPLSITVCTSISIPGHEYELEILNKYKNG